MNNHYHNAVLEAEAAEEAVIATREAVQAALEQERKTTRGMISAFIVDVYTGSQMKTVLSDRDYLVARQMSDRLPRAITRTMNYLMAGEAAEEAHD